MSLFPKKKWSIPLSRMICVVMALLGG